MAFNKQARRAKIKSRIRKTITGTAERPRLCVFRSNKQIYAQLIDDVAGVTIAAASSKEKSIAATKTNKTEISVMVGKQLASKASNVGVKDVVFDRGGYLYHGRVKALAEGAREGGLVF